MKTVIKALLAASMLMPIAAQAQERDRPGRDGGPRGEWSDRGPRPEDGGPQGQWGGDRPPRPDGPRPEGPRPDPGPRPDLRPDPRDDGPPRGDFRGPRGDDRRGPGPVDDWRRDDRGPRAGFDRPPPPPRDREAWRNDARRWDDRGAWNRGWRNDQRYDWNRYRALNRGAYRLPRYYAPRGWGYGYRRFPVGGSLSTVLFDRNYWIQDPYSYRLPDAYGPYRWVRYYDDALLVDLRSGVVVDTAYGIFY